MVRNEQKYQQAIEFRKRGFTLEEIAKVCDISKSTASKWLKNKAFSETVTAQNKHRAGLENAMRLRLVNKARSGERAKKYTELKKAAATEYRHYKNSPLFVAGIMAYLAHGELKSLQQIRLATCDQFAHGVFIRFAKEFLGVETPQIRHWLFLYQGQSEEVSMKSWKRALGIPYQQFHKTQYSSTRATKNTLHKGVGNTIIGSTVLKRKLLVWSKLLQKDLKK